MKILRFSIVLLIVLFYSCADFKSKQEMQKIPIMDIAILHVPETFSIQKDSAIDISRYTLVFNKDSEKKIFVEYGYTINRLTASEPEIVIDSTYYQIVKTTSDSSSYFYRPDIDCKDLDLFRLQNVTFDTLDQRLVKVITPRRFAIGMTGFHFYRIRKKDRLMGSFKMNVYGHNLNVNETNELYEIIENIEWVEKCETCADIGCW